MKFITSMLTNKGGKDRNEDFPQFFYKEDCCGIWAIADGLGIQLDGEIASKIAGETCIKEFLSKSILTVDNIENIFLTANNSIIDARINQRLKNGMRTTLVGLFTNCKEVLWAHAGNSRLYFFRKGMAPIQTKDHSLSQKAVDSGEILSSEIPFHEDRRQLLRVLGNVSELRAETLNSPLQVLPEDAFLLCSDGFWELIHELEIQIDLCKSNSPEEWLSYMSERILRRVKNDFDNFSAIAVFVE